jgi:hypothetical protein
VRVGLERRGLAVLFDVRWIRQDEAFAAMREDERFKKAVCAVCVRGYLWLLERPDHDPTRNRTS